MRARPLSERLDKKTLERLYHGQGLTLVQIANRYASHGPTVHALMEKYGIPRRPPPIVKR